MKKWEKKKTEIKNCVVYDWESYVSYIRKKGVDLKSFEDSKKLSSLLNYFGWKGFEIFFIIGSMNFFQRIGRKITGFKKL